MEIAILDTFLQKMGLYKTEEMSIGLAQPELWEKLKQIAGQTKPVKSMWDAAENRVVLLYKSHTNEDLQLICQFGNGKNGNDIILSSNCLLRSRNSTLIMIKARAKYSFLLHLLLIPTLIVFATWAEITGLFAESPKPLWAILIVAIVHSTSVILSYTSILSSINKTLVIYANLLKKIAK